jgi:protein gp37
MIFTCSMSDFFLNEADPWREEAWKLIHDTPQHTWQILTKRPQRIKECLPKDWYGGYRNVWLGVSVESRKHLDRIAQLRDTPAWVRFLSCEPLLEDLGSLDLLMIDWMIVGGESGLNHRPMQDDWVRNIKRQCEYYNAAFFYKQPSGIRTELPALLDGKEHKNWPKVSTGFGTTVQRFA